MPAIYVTIGAGQDYVIGDPDSKFPFSVGDVSGGTLIGIPDTGPPSRGEGFDYVFKAGSEGYGQFIEYNPAFSEVQAYFFTITGPNGAVAPLQTSVVAQPETIHVAGGDTSIPLTAFTANDTGPYGDALYVTVTSPFHFSGTPAGSTDAAGLSDVTGSSTPDTLGLLAQGGELQIFADNADGSPVSSGTLTFDYTVTDGFGTTSAPVQATVQIGPPTQPATYVYGTALDDTIDKSTSHSAWLINGAAGNDLLRGGSAGDALNGGAGDDRISGGAGNDTITGGPGADSMMGGPGDDTFVFKVGDFATGSSKDIIYDFEGAGQPGGDFIHFTGFSANAQLVHLSDEGTISKYEVVDGANSGEFWIQDGGVPLQKSDYGFFAY